MPIGTGGGRQLGFASGSIRIDTTETERAAVTVRRVGQDIKRSLGEVDSLANRTGSTIGRGFSSIGSGLRSFANDIRQVRTELVSIGLAAGALTKIGLDGAKSIRNYRVSFTQLLGDQEQAVALMRELTDQANRFGLEVDETWQLARALLPSLEGNTEELGKFVTRAALLASTNPLKSTVDASRAIQEYLSGQTISLQRLFNVDPNIIAEAQAEFEGVGEQLDYILGRLGATEEGALQMADSFTAVKNELKLALAEGFTPLFQQLQPLAREFSQFVSELRQSNPALLTLGSGLIGVVAVGAPLLVFLGQVITSLEKIRALSIAGTLGRAGVVAGALVGGAVIGNAIGRGIGRATGNESVANFGLEQVGNAMKQLLFLAADSLSKLIVIIQDLVLRAVQAFVNGITAMIGGMSQFVRTIGEILPDSLGGEKLRKIADDMETFAANIETAAEQSRQILGQVALHGRDELLNRLQGFLFPSPADTTVTTGTGTAVSPTSAGGFSEEQTAAIVAWWEQIREIEAQQAQARLQATQQYEEQRTELIDNYGRQMAREEEDFLRQRARQNAQLEAEIAGIRQEAREREAGWLADLNERIAEIRDEGNDRIAEIEQDYNDQRERREAEHRNNLLNAASRLDARAIAEEQRRFGLQETTAANELQKRVRQERENLEERIQQEQDAHQERLQAAREADEERINDMRQALADQQRLEDEDRAIRLRRMQEDHDRQLQALKDANRKRLDEIDAQGQKELAQLNQKFQRELAQQGLASAQQLTYQRKAQNDALKEFQQYWDDWNDIIGKQNDANPLKDKSKSKGKGFQSGGVVDYTGLATVHGSSARPEFMLDANTTAALRGMMGNFSQAQLLGAVAGGRSSSITLADGAIRVYGLPGQSPEDIGRAVRNEFAELLAELTK